MNAFSEEKGICWIADEFSEFRREQNEFPFFVYFSCGAKKTFVRNTP